MSASDLLVVCCLEGPGAAKEERCLLGFEGLCRKADHVEKRLLVVSSGSGSRADLGGCYIYIYHISICTSAYQLSLNLASLVWSGMLVRFPILR